VWWDRAALDVYLGTRRVAAWGPGREIVSHAVEGFSPALEAVTALLDATSRGQHVRVWLSGGLCRAFLLEPVEGVPGHADRLRVAASMAPRLTGLSGPCHVWLDRAGHDDAAVGVAMEEATLGALVESIRSRSCRLSSVRPWWSEPLRVQAKAGALIVGDCDSVTTLAGEGRRFACASTLAPLADDAAVAAAVMRQRLASEATDVRIARLQFDATAGPSAVTLDHALAAATEWSS